MKALEREGFVLTRGNDVLESLSIGRILGYRFAEVERLTCPVVDDEGEVVRCDGTGYGGTAFLDLINEAAKEIRDGGVSWLVQRGARVRERRGERRGTREREKNEPPPQQQRS